jgi:hypothetical protein
MSLPLQDAPGAEEELPGDAGGALMIAYTMLSLWILAQPVVEAVK